MALLSSSWWSYGFATYLDLDWTTCLRCCRNPDAPFRRCPYPTCLRPSRCTLPPKWNLTIHWHLAHTTSNFNVISTSNLESINKEKVGFWEVKTGWVTHPCNESYLPTWGNLIRSIWVLHLLVLVPVTSEVVVLSSPGSDLPEGSFLPRYTYSYSYSYSYTYCHCRYLYLPNIYTN